ncbi:MAG: toprim domain-containing protein [Candidatus Paceibacterota bacterium]|jgi:recombination protein RecR
MLPQPIQQFVRVFSRLPLLGPRLATRLALHLISLDRASFQELKNALIQLEALDRCPRCFFLKNENAKLCDICADPRRNPRIIAIVEKETDIMSLEKTHKFSGHYLILGELPEKGVLENIQKSRLQHLHARITQELNGMTDEIIVALNPNSFGDFVAGIINEEFKTGAKKITRLGRGIPTGGEIEFADEETLGSALERRI